MIVVAILLLSMLTAGLSEDITQKWWGWISAIPIKESPLFDKNGTFTQKHMYQDGIYFLTGYINSKNAPGQLSETREITVKTDTPILAPVLNGLETASVSDIQKVWYQLNPFAGQELHDRLQALNEKKHFSATKMVAELDGKPIKWERITSPLFSVDLNNDKILFSETNEQVGEGLSVADGWWVYIPELEPGTHSLYLLGMTADYKAEVRYSIKVI